MPSSFCMWRHSKNTAIHPPGGWLSPHTESACTLILDFLGSRTVTYICLLLGTSLTVQWLSLWAPSAEGLGLIPGQGTRSRMSQRRSKFWCAKIWRSQINKKKKKKKKFVADKLPSLWNSVMGCLSGLRENAIINFFFTFTWTVEWGRWPSAIFWNLLPTSKSNTAACGPGRKHMTLHLLGQTVTVVVDWSELVMWL